MKITVYCDREGILRYNPDGWPEKPSDPGEWAHQEFHREYYEEKAKWRKDIEKAKSESVPFENQKITAEWAHIKPDSFYDVKIEGVVLVKTTITTESVNKVAQIVKSELSGNSGQLPNIDMAARLCASKGLGIEPEDISLEDAIIYGFKAGFKAAQTESLEVLEYALERIKYFDRCSDPYIERFIKRAKE